MTYREFHQGLDFSCTNAPVKNIAGTKATVNAVNDTNPNHDAGYYVQLKVDNVYFTYQHLQSISVNGRDRLKVGDTVEAGQQFAISGNTGVGTGYHLHVTVANTSDLSPRYKTAASNPSRKLYVDPRMFID